MLIAVAALLIVVGLASAMSAPGAPPRSNKADAYGGPVPTKPTNPKSVGECNKYYGAANQLADARQCRAIAKRNAGLKACAKKHGAAKRKCQAAVKKTFGRNMSAIAKQRTAENACGKAYNQQIQALNPDDPNYDSQLQTDGAAFQACMKKARGA